MKYEVFSLSMTSIRYMRCVHALSFFVFSFQMFEKNKAVKCDVQVIVANEQRKIIST